MHWGRAAQAGVSNVVADGLSWPQDTLVCHVAADVSSSDSFSTGASAPVLDYRLMAAEQLVFPEVATLRANSSLGLDTQHVDGHILLMTSAREHSGQ